MSSKENDSINKRLVQKLALNLRSSFPFSKYKKLYSNAGTAAKILCEEIEDPSKSIPKINEEFFDNRISEDDIRKLKEITTNFKVFNRLHIKPNILGNRHKNIRFSYPEIKDYKENALYPIIEFFDLDTKNKKNKTPKNILELMGYSVESREYSSHAVLTHKLKVEDFINKIDESINKNFMKLNPKHLEELQELFENFRDCGIVFNSTFFLHL